MFEELIMQLDELGVQYTEDYEAGILTIDIGAVDKMALVSVIQIANDSGMEFSIDETSLTIMSGAPVEGAGEYPEEPDLAAMQDDALGQLF